MSEPLRILITGSRSWTDRSVITRAICDYIAEISIGQREDRPPPIIVHGGARGADFLADEIARAWGWPVECHPADWRRYGRAAGPRRNAEMVALGADVVLAFPIGASPGTCGCISLARTVSIPVRVYEGRVEHARASRGVQGPENASNPSRGQRYGPVRAGRGTP